MKQKHNTFKRIFHRICEELKATYDVAQVIHGSGISNIPCKD